jgi:hypothetical protein
MAGIYIWLVGAGHAQRINCLAAVVGRGFNLDPCGEALFVFFNRRRERLKILEWGGDGF